MTPFINRWFNEEVFAPHVDHFDEVAHFDATDRSATVDHFDATDRSATVATSETGNSFFMA